jgi:hypothetical protein
MYKSKRNLLTLYLHTDLKKAEETVEDIENDQNMPAIAEKEMIFNKGVTKLSLNIESFIFEWRLYKCKETFQRCIQNESSTRA